MLDFNRKRDHKRRTYVVDSKMQTSVALTCCGILVVLGLSYVSVIAVLPEESVNGLTGKEVANLLLQMNLVFCLLCMAGFWLAAMLITHRVAGPARVLQHALDGFKSGDYSRRLTLRKRDYLKKLAVSVGELGTRMQQDDERRNRLIEQLEQKLDEEGDGRFGDLLKGLRGFRSATTPSNDVVIDVDVEAGSVEAPEEEPLTV